MDFAHLGFDVDSRPVGTATDRLNKFTRAGRKAHQSADGFSKKSSMMAASLGRMAGQLAVAAGSLVALGGALQVLSGFEQQIAKVGAVSRATADQLEDMRRIAKELGSTTEFTGIQAAEGLEFLARAGFSAEDAISAIPSVLDLATAAAMDLGSAADITSNIMSAFGLSADESSAAADILAAVSARANTDVQQLGEAMKMVGPVSDALGVSMSDTAAAIGVLSDAGIQGGSAGTGLRRVLSGLANATPQAVKALEAMGVALEDVNPETQSLVEIVDELAEAGLSAADALTIFGDRGGPAILALVKNNDRLAKLTGELRNVDGEAKRMAETMRDNLGGDFDSAISAAQGLILALGEAGLTAVLRALTQLVTGFLRGLTAMVDGLRQASSAAYDFVRGIFGIQTAEEIHETVLDNVTIAMGDQMRASAELNRVLNEGLPLTLDVVQAKLEEAKARRANVEQLIREREEAELQALGYSDLLNRISNTRANLDALRTPGDDLEQMPTIIRDAYEAAEQELASLLVRQQEMLDQVRERRMLTEEEQAQYDAIEANIAALLDRQGELTGETRENVELTDRLKVLAGAISFDSATASAAALARQLGVNLEIAQKLDATLDRQAGIQRPGPERLTFGTGVPDPTTPGGFVAAGGELGFSGNFGPNPDDFIAANTRGTAGAGAAKAATEELTAVQREANRVLEEARRAAVGYSEVQAELDKTLAAGKITQDEYNAAIDIAKEKYIEVSDATKFWEEQQKTLKDGILDAIVAGEDLADTFRNIAQAIARAALEAALFGTGPFSSGGSGLLGGLVSGLFSFDGGGYTGNAPRVGGMDGKGGYLAMVHPQEQVVDLSKGQSDGGGSATVTIVAPEGFSVEQEGRIQGISIKTVQRGLEEYDRTQLPTSVKRINDDPTRRG